MLGNGLFMVANARVNSDGSTRTSLGIHPAIPGKTLLMAKPNYQFEKRRKELEKKRKKEEKRQLKLENKAAEPKDTPDQPQE